MNSDLERQMRPGALSEAGFLGLNERLNDVISVDLRTLQRLGLTFQQFADRLETLSQKAHGLMHGHRGDNYWKIVEKGLLVEKKYRISWNTYMGYQKCPFGCAENADTDYTIVNVETGESVFFSGLHIHLIREHQFFEGHTKYRLDPETCARVLDIKAGVEYTPVYTHKEYWVGNGGCCISSYRTVDDYLSSHWVGQDEKMMKTIQTGVPVDVGDGLYALSNGEELLIISLTSHKRGVVIDGVPIWDLSEGMYMYKKHTFKWVES